MHWEPPVQGGADIVSRWLQQNPLMESLPIRRPYLLMEILFTMVVEKSSAIRSSDTMVR